MKKKVLYLLVLGLAVFMTACGDQVEKSEENSISSAQNETGQQVDSAESSYSETDENVAVDTESETTAPVVGELQENMTRFESDYGYCITYDEACFDYRRTEGYDEYILKSDEVDKPFVFICISHVGAEFVETVKGAALGTSQEACTIGREKTEAECGETEEDWEGGKIIHKTCVCPLDSGDALLIEMQWYTEGTDDAYSSVLQDIVDSIEL